MKVHVSLYKNLSFSFAFVAVVFVAYCLLGLSCYAVLLSDSVSVTIESERCRFRSNVSRSLKLPQRPSFLQFFYRNVA